MVKNITRRSRKTGGVLDTFKHIIHMARPIKQSDYTQKCIDIVDEQLEFMKTNGKDVLLNNAPNFAKNYMTDKVNDLHYKRTIFINKCIKQLKQDPTSQFSIYMKQNGEHLPIKNPMSGGKRKQTKRRNNRRNRTNKRKN